ncbi:Partial AB-hydrolase lipase domain,Alpha/Beta hydrolase fold [Cinara cedri]|uniref:Partial AB-hydrolase lipase domain,Alpha/Beta hydrolase fold n=1 Tax=Cinara cedri TaxID=506608 RepID=A0A5E4LXI6_9HEMI|nr:Partial AB-hydrolase lipase domain,Alpha/Beta hydrolase fold [Cinara cedri]
MKKMLFLSRKLGILQRILVIAVLPLIIITLSTNISALSVKDTFHNISLSTVEILHNNGYDVEVHNAITEDGYVLELHRIPRSKSGQEPTKNYPVFLHHGIFGSSADWVLAGANMSLPMQLADDGHDVWLANCRGNTYSKNHVSLTVKEKYFWNFSLHEIGKYDLPAAIDYILSESNTSQLHYIGYSMGTTVFFIMASERPEYHIKIRSQISLAPVAYMSNSRSIINYIAPYGKYVNAMLQTISNGRLMPHSTIQSYLAFTMCREKLMRNLICAKCIIFSICGSDPYDFDSDLIPIISGHYPAGTSSKLAAHFAQFMMNDNFSQYDYGPVMNLHYYNSTIPPMYNLESNQVPTTLFYGDNDLIADVKDVAKLKSQLPKLMDFVLVDNPYCNHLDFMWSINVNSQINDPIKAILKETDVMAWKYTGPRPSTTIQETNNDGLSNAVDRMPNSINNMETLPDLDFFEENLDTIIAKTMPRSVEENDVTEFQRQREVLNIILRNLMNFIKSIDMRKKSLQDGFTNELSEWNDHVATRLARIQTFLLGV